MLFTLILQSSSSNELKSSLVIADTSRVDSGCGDRKINRDEKNKFAKKKNCIIAKFKNLVRPKNHDFFSKSENKKISNRLGFLTAKTRLTFIKLRQLLIEALVFCHFDPKYHI